MLQKDSHCSYCGQAFPAEQPWPRACRHCGNVSYLNPVPVAAVLLPVGRGLLTVRRAIDPRKGELTFPGGFVQHGESWQQAATRELYEETGIRIENPQELDVFDVLSTSRGHLVIFFGRARPRRLEDLPPFTPTEEGSELHILYTPAELAFPQDTAVAIKFFAAAGRGDGTERGRV